MQSKDKKQYKRTCYSCHIAQTSAFYSEALRKQAHNNFPELYCNKCMKAKRLIVRNAVVEYTVEENYLVMKLEPSLYSEPFMPFKTSNSIYEQR